ncbi:MAG: dihydrofolate reductase [Oscillospiraceae bacterium]
MTLILAADNDWAIGKNGALLTHIPADMKFFRETTQNSTIVMGRKTWDSFPKKPLPNRTNCVISRSVKKLDGAQVFDSVEDFLQYAKTIEGKIFVIGGGEIYRQLLPYCDEALITRIYECFDGDVFFPELDREKDWEVAETSTALESECRRIRFFRYVRKNPS